MQPRRFYLEIVGRRRFKIQRAFEQDGYRVAVPEWFRDTPPAEGSPEAQVELPKLADEVMGLTENIMDAMRSNPCAVAPHVSCHHVRLSGHLCCQPLLHKRQNSRC